MQAPSEQRTASSWQALLQDGALAGDWVLDPRTSSIRFKSKALGLPVTGAFREISGRGTVSPGGEVGGTVTAVASVDAGNTRRDTHLRSADFFDSGNHPGITFTAGGIRPVGQGVAVTGALTVRGRTQPVLLARARLPARMGPRLLRDLPRARRRAYGSGYQDESRLPLEVVRAWLEPLFGTPAAARQFQRWVTSLHARDPLAAEPALRRLQVPTLIVWGTEDVFFHRKWPAGCATPSPARWKSPRSQAPGCSSPTSARPKSPRPCAGTGTHS